MSSGGVEPETVTLWRWTRRDGHGWMRHRLDLPGPWESQEFVPLSALRLVEEELRQERDLRRRAEETRENANAVSLRVEGENRRLSEELRQAREERDRASTLSTGWAAESGRWEARYNEAVADRDRLAEALREIADQDWVENVLDPQWAARIAEAALSPVQGEHHAQPEGESQMDDNNLNHLIGERDAMKWVDGFLTVVPDADRDLMHTWFACAIESGRMTIQGEHEQDGEDGVSPSLDEVYAERNKVVLAFAALVKEQGWDVGLTVDPSSPDWPVLMIETDAGQVSWHFQAGELPPGLPLFAGKWDGHSTPEKYARLAELVRSAFGLSREIAQDGDTEETT